MSTQKKMQTSYMYDAGNTCAIRMFFYVACPTGCSLCNGPQNSDCFACQNTNLYRDTTNVLNATCVTHCVAGTTQGIDVFGVRTCFLGEYQYININM